MQVNIKMLNENSRNISCNYFSAALSIVLTVVFLWANPYIFLLFVNDEKSVSPQSSGSSNSLKSSSFKITSEK